MILLCKWDEIDVKMNYQWSGIKCTANDFRIEMPLKWWKGIEIDVVVFEPPPKKTPTSKMVQKRSKNN